MPDLQGDSFIGLLAPPGHFGETDVRHRSRARRMGPVRDSRPRQGRRDLRDQEEVPRIVENAAPGQRRRRRGIREDCQSLCSVGFSIYRFSNL